MSLFGSAAPATSSLFSNTAGAGSTGQTQSLFGNAASQAGTAPAPNVTSSAPSGFSLFNNNNPNAQTTSSLFTNVLGSAGGPAKTTAAATGGLFGTAANLTQPSSGGLFGGLGGGNPGSNAASQPTASGGLFGGLGAANSGSKTGLFGASASNQPAQGSTLFQNNTAPNQSMLGAQQTGQSTQSGDQTPFHSAYFNSLLEKNKKRARDSGQDGFGEMPGLHLGLGDISKRVRELSGVGGEHRRDRQADSKAHYLLAASGVNPGTTLRDLNAFGTSGREGGPSLAPQPPLLDPSADLWDPDSHKYVEQQQQRMTQKMITEGIERANRNFDAYVAEHMDINWEQQRRRVYEHFGLTPISRDSLSGDTAPGTADKGGFGKSSRRGRQGFEKTGAGTPNRSVFGQSGLQKSVIGAPLVGAGNMQLFGESTEKVTAAPGTQDDRFGREKQGRFAEKVQTLNENRLREEVFPVLDEFRSIEDQPSFESPSQLSDAYAALAEIVGEDGKHNLRPRCYAARYLDETPNSAESKLMKKMILDGSRNALEKQFYTQVKAIVARNIREASLGGVPTPMNEIRAYIRVRAARKDLAPDNVELQKLSDDYCWALIFFLLRAGRVEDAAQYVTENATAFKALDRVFVTYITAYAKNKDRRLSTQQYSKMNSDYNQRMRQAPDGSLDPYRMACYKVIGRCELSKRTLDNIPQGVEDWMWLQFCLARDVDRTEEFATEVYGLEEIQETIHEIGQRHFGKGSLEGTGGYGTFFYLQILGGMFEQAVAYLYSHAYVSAVHFAIALDFYGLLRVADFDVSEADLLTHTTKNQPQLSFGRMIGYYTRDFRAESAVTATDYLVLLHLNADLPGQLGKSQADLCHEALRELVLETREFAQLLGDVHENGTRVPGAIEKRLKLIGLSDQEAYLRTVTLQAASVADDNGRTTDAVLLYHLAEDYDNVIQILNRALSDAIAVDINAEPFALQPLKPRDASRQSRQPEAGQPGNNSSLSMAGVQDPIQLAVHFVSLYDRHEQTYEKIRPRNRDVCGILLKLADTKARVQAESWADALDVVASTNLLPLHANGSIPAIRQCASNLASYPSVISRLVGPLLLWTIHSVARQREHLQQGSEYENETRQAMRDDLVGKAKDLMVFAGLVKLRLGKGVWDGIVAGAGDVGVY